MGRYLLARTRCMIATAIPSKRGQGMVEYALIIAFVVVVAAGLINSGGIKNKVTEIFTNLNTTLDNAASK